MPTARPSIRPRIGVIEAICTTPERESAPSAPIPTPVSAVTSGTTLDFLPGNRRDTGGRNWAELFSKIDRSKIPVLQNEVIRVREGEGDNFQADYFQLIGDWLHMINGSNWAMVADKDKLLESTIANFETMPKRRWSAEAQKYI